MFITELKDDNSVSIVQYTGNEAIVQVPGEIDGKTVSQIAVNAFRGCGFLLAVSLPESLRYIGDYAFCECRGLKEITIPFHVESVGSHAFYNCRNLTKIQLPSALRYIGDGFIKNCDDIEEITIDSWKPISSGVAALLNEFKQYYRLNIKDIGAQLIFPDYDFEYISNAPAMKCNTVTHGAGYRYRLAVESRGIQFHLYDEAFVKAQIEEKDEIVIEIALARLKTPFSLRDEAQRRYLDYLSTNLDKVVAYFGKTGDLSFLELLKRLGVFTRDNINCAVETSAKIGSSELAAFILDLKLSSFGGSEKVFDL